MAGYGATGRHRRARGSRGLLAALGVLVAIALLIVVGVPAWSAANARQSTAPTEVVPTSAPTPATPTPTSGTPAPAPTGSPAPVSATGEALLRAIAALSDAPGGADRPYDRDAFGQAWYDEDGNGCDTRNDILRRDLTDTVLKADSNGCKVLSGRLDDLYTRSVVQFVSGSDTSSLVQIDHIVPLSWAWQHGADAWTDEQRRAFANDPVNLLATVGSVNMAKSDSGPSEWMPPAASSHCEYAERFVEVLADWSLGIDAADRSSLEATARTCN